jgi:hypothetical protein
LEIKRRVQVLSNTIKKNTFLGVRKSIEQDWPNYLCAKEQLNLADIVPECVQKLKSLYLCTLKNNLSCSLSTNYKLKITMLKNVFILLGCLVALASCSKQSAAVSLPEGAQQFGAPITVDKTMSYDELMTKMAKVDSMDAKVKGKISAVCQKKGCWMTMVSDKPGQPDMRVTFKDYAFFMPKDIMGRTVVIDGFAIVETTSVADLRHYAEDDGKSPAEIAKITQPKREVAFEAKGVILLK